MENLHPETFKYLLSTHFEISFSNTFNTFRILFIFHVVAMGTILEIYGRDLENRKFLCSVSKLKVIS